MHCKAVFVTLVSWNTSSSSGLINILMSKIAGITSVCCITSAIFVLVLNCSVSVNAMKVFGFLVIFSFFYHMLISTQDHHTCIRIQHIRITFLLQSAVAMPSCCCSCQSWRVACHHRSPEEKRHLAKRTTVCKSNFCPTSWWPTCLNNIMARLALSDGIHYS